MRNIKRNLCNLLLFVNTALLLFMISCTDEQFIQVEAFHATASTRSIDDNAEAIECGTVAVEPPSWFFASTLSSEDTQIDITKRYVFRVRVIVVNSNTSNYPAQIGSTVVANMNSYFEGTGISFTLAGSESIVSDYYANTHYNNVLGVSSIKCYSNAINVYVISESIEGAYGVAYMFNNKLAIRGNRINHSTLPHEVGHCLGLYHTHYGTDPEGDEGVPELVDGSNSSVAGDYVVDTPADPNKWVNGVYSWNGTDANGDYYNPDPSNFMSYSYVGTKFTSKQILRMHQTIENTMAVRAACDVSTVSIEGSTYIGSSENYSIDCDDSYSVNWSVKCETFTGLNGSVASVDTLTYMGKSFTLTNMSPNATSQKYTLTATMTTPEGLSGSVVKTVYHVLPSSSTGLLRWSSENPSGNYYYGQIDLDGYTSSSNPIKVQKRGKLYFYYSDASGAYSYQQPEYYNFDLLDNYGIFTKESNASHIFVCNANAGAGSVVMPMFLGINGMSKTLTFTVTVLN